MSRFLSNRNMYSGGGRPDKSLWTGENSVRTRSKLVPAVQEAVGKTGHIPFGVEHGVQLPSERDQAAGPVERQFRLVFAETGQAGDQEISLDFYGVSVFRQNPREQVETARPFCEVRCTPREPEVNVVVLRILTAVAVEHIEMIAEPDAHVYIIPRYH